MLLKAVRSFTRRDLFLNTRVHETFLFLVWIPMDSQAIKKHGTLFAFEAIFRSFKQVSCQKIIALGTDFAMLFFLRLARSLL